MNDRVMLKAKASENFITFRTVSRKKKSPYFYVQREELAALRYQTQAVIYDYSFAVFSRNQGKGTIMIRFFWLNSSDTHTFTGWDQLIELPYEPFMAFVENCGCDAGPTEWQALSILPEHSPRLAFISRRNLRDTVSDKLTRRKLCKFLRDNFHWSNCTEIRFYDDFIPRSFLFREMRYGKEGIVGGLILHGQEDMKKAYYCVHT